MRTTVPNRRLRVLFLQLGFKDVEFRSPDALRAGFRSLAVPNYEPKRLPFFVPFPERKNFLIKMAEPRNLRRD